MNISSESRLDPLISSEEIQRRVVEMAAEIRHAYGDEQILLVGVLKGSFLFLADLCRHLGTNVAMDFVQVSSYGNEKSSSGVVQN